VTTGVNLEVNLFDSRMPNASDEAVFDAGITGSTITFFINDQSLVEEETVGGVAGSTVTFSYLTNQLFDDVQFSYGQIAGTKNVEIERNVPVVTDTIESALVSVSANAIKTFNSDRDRYRSRVGSNWRNDLTMEKTSVNVALAADQDDLNPTGLANLEVIRFTITGAVDRTINSIADPGYRKVLLLVNSDTSNNVLIANEGTGTAANKFATPSAVTFTIVPQGMATIYYDEDQSRWRIM